MFQKKKSLWLFLLPGLVLLMVFYVIPFLGGIRHSVTDGSFQNRFVGLTNYRQLWQNDMFLLGLKNTMELSLICAPLRCCPIWPPPRPCCWCGWCFSITAARSIAS